jgi:MinD superfamily P-loop ATPase
MLSDKLSEVRLSDDQRKVVLQEVSERNTYKIAVASGKGGTGKTTIATSLALSLAAQGVPVVYADCDVEEPNGHIFLKPEISASLPIGIPVPAVNEQLCTSCRLCGQACQFSAIICIDNLVLTFPELCHGCGGCVLVCPPGALYETQRDIGTVRIGEAGKIGFLDGLLRVGEAMSAPLIRAVKKHLPHDHVAIIDAPPGTSCPVIEAVKDTDFVLLVTEPTPFGLNDLTLAVGMVRELGLPFAVIINRSDIGFDRTVRYCEEENIAVLLQIPDSRQIAEAYSRGQTAIDAIPALKSDFDRIWKSIRDCDRMRSIK